MAYNKSIFSRGTVSYKDLDIAFLSNPSTGDLREKSDLEAIKQSLKNLIYTKYGDFGFRPNFGGNLDGLLFEQLDEVTKDLLTVGIRNTVQTYEPRVKILKLVVQESKADPNELDIGMWFNLENAATPQQINLILKRVR